ncbi:hypothetical protein llap_8360 [Limosa lapponica baueri]|uniref:Uncharacterized protein n=1 Tax=Limosa lapponica baueri TaxID=1758121 RepID=A0A2I0U5I8_LIMLA|nr:hypothetical protein llap_8360 [Limosa lapponica baueri]
MLLAFLATRAHCWLMLSRLSTNTPSKTELETGKGSRDAFGGGLKKKKKKVRGGVAGEVAAAWGLRLVLAGTGSTAGILALLQPRGQPGTAGVILAEELNKLLDNAFNAEIKNLVQRVVSGGSSEVTAVCLAERSCLRRVSRLSGQEEDLDLQEGPAKA